MKMVNKKKKLNPIWYVLPVIEIVSFFVPASWIGLLGGMLLSLVVFAASIVGIVGFFLIRKSSMAVALINLVVGIIVLLILILSVILGAIIQPT